MKKNTGFILFIITILCFAAYVQAGPTVSGGGGNGSGWSQTTDCSSITTLGVGCYNTSSKVLCIGNGSSCVSQGAVSINPRGAYSAGTEYALMDSVSYNGSSYLAIQTTTGNLPTNATYWQLLAAKGDTGSNGTNGADGASAYVYVAYASDDSGTDFTTTFSAALNYIAVKKTTSPIASPQASDFAGLWKNYKGTTGNTGGNGSNGANGAGYGGTSTSSLAVGTGSKTFTTQAGLAYVVGSRVRATSASTAADWMEGVVTSYSSTTLIINVDTVGSGTDTKTDWNLSLSGEPGIGITTGTDGTHGVSMNGNTSTFAPANGFSYGYTFIGGYPYAYFGSANFALAYKDVNGNVSANNHLLGYTTTATAAGTTTLTVASANQQFFTGTTTQTVVLPVASTLTDGHRFVIVNNSTGIVTITTSGTNTVQAMAASSYMMIVCINHSGGTGTASWSWEYIPSLTSMATTVASGSIALATSSISSAACQTVTQGSVNSAAATGVATTDVISFSANASIKAVTGYTPATTGGLTIVAYPTAGYVNFDVCNWTASAITPGAVTINWRVSR